MLSGRTNDEVKADPDRMWRSRPAARPGVDRARDAAAVAGPDPGRAGRARTRCGNGGTWEVFGRELRLTNLDKVLFPGRDGEAPVTKRELIGYAARIAPVVLPYLAGRAAEHAPLPRRRRPPGFWHKQLPDHAPDWVPRWDNPDAEPGETHTYLVVDEPAALVWAANFGALEWHAWTAQRRPSRHSPTYALIDIDPGPATSWDDVLVAGPAAPHRAGAPGRARAAEGDRPARHPDLDPDRPRARLRRHPRVGQAAVHAVGAVVPDLVSWEWDVESAAGLARLDYTQNVMNKTLVAPVQPARGAGRAGVRADRAGTSSTTRRCGPTASRSGPCLTGWPQRGDPFRTVLDADQTLPPIH